MSANHDERADSLTDYVPSTYLSRELLQRGRDSDRDRDERDVRDERDDDRRPDDDDDDLPRIELPSAYCPKGWVEYTNGEDCLKYFDEKVRPFQRVMSNNNATINMSSQAHKNKRLSAPSQEMESLHAYSNIAWFPRECTRKRLTFT